MLMTMRAFNEAARALILWTALRADIARRSADAGERAAAEDHLALLTPVIKGVLTDQGFANTVVAQQIFGGHGYIAEHGMEQFVRDARIAMIYEGANGIQALGAIKSRNDLDTAMVDDVVLGVVDPVGEAAADIARTAALVAGYGDGVAGVQINRFCASGPVSYTHLDVYKRQVGL